MYRVVGGGGIWQERSASFTAASNTADSANDNASKYARKYNLSEHRPTLVTMIFIDVHIL